MPGARSKRCRQARPLTRLGKLAERERPGDFSGSSSRVGSGCPGTGSPVTPSQNRTCLFSSIRLALCVFLETCSIRECSLMESMMTGLAEDQRFPVASCHQLLPESFSFRHIFHLSYVVDLKWS